MMSRQLFTSNLFCLVVSIIISFSLSTTVFSAEGERIKGPIIITSDRLTADNQTHSAIFENSVVARTTDMTIYADRMLVNYDKDTGNVTKIDAVGRVKLIKENMVITSNEAIYYAEGDKVIFTGDPRAVDGKNVVTGTKMTYLLNEDRFLVEGSKVFLKKNKEQ
jgi:lipopolysaccharide export system protein LptA